ncbi:MAG TPA: hypothetical protein PKV98_07760 [Burkholderiaceae bacterium]|nr:hypothetical protein [Burkholderiaceae bacterium]
MGFAFISTSAKSAWAAATNKTAQLEGLRDVWSGQLRLKHYSSSGTLLATVVHATPVVDTVNWELVPGAYVSQTVWASGVPTYCVWAVPGGADILRADSTWDAADPTISDPGGRVRADIGSQMGLAATASLPATDIPAWVASISTTQWTEISASPVFSTAIDALTPAHTNAQYRPGRAAAITAIRDAYCDWEYDPVAKKFYLFGGGHLDGSHNGVIAYDAATLTYSMPVSPTLVYPDSYVNANSVPTYPSGYNAPGGFADAATITANSGNPSIDLPFAADKNATTSSHTYGCMIYHGGKLRRFYSQNVAAVLSTGQWENLGVDSIGPNIPAAGDTWQPGSEYNTNSLAEATLATFDQSRGNVWTTLINGPITGDSWRGGLLEIDPDTIAITRLVNLGGTMTGDCSLVIAEPYLYVLRPVSNALATGWRVHLDTYAVQWLTFAGDLPTTISEHVLPAYFDGTKLRIWAYRTDADALYDINQTEASGAGTSGSPYVLNVTRTALTASSIPTPSRTYRLHYDADWGVLMVHPAASSKWWALRATA